MSAARNPDWGAVPCSRTWIYTPSQLDQNRLHGILPLPLCETRKLARVDKAVTGVYAGEVDLADELDGRGLVGVLGAAVHLDAVDAVLVDGLNNEGLLKLRQIYIYIYIRTYVGGA